MNILRKHFQFTLQHPVFIILCSLLISGTPSSLQGADRALGDAAEYTAEQTAKHTAKNNPLEQCYNAAKLSQPKTAQAVAGVRACTHALRNTPLGKKSRAQVYLHRGVLHKKSRQPELALRDFYRAKRVAGDSPALSINIGNVYYLKRDFYRAIDAYDSALAMNFKAPHKALLNRGLANERLGRRQDAINAYAKALAFEPAMATARERLQALTSTASALAFSKQSEVVVPALHTQHSHGPLVHPSPTQGAAINRIPINQAPIDIVALAAR